MMLLESVDAVAILAAIAAAVGTTVLSIVGFLLVRAVNKVDSSVSGLSSKVDALAAQDTNILVQLEGMKVQVLDMRERVLRLEVDFRAKQISDVSRQP